MKKILFTDLFDTWSQLTVYHVSIIEKVKQYIAMQHEEDVRDYMIKEQYDVLLNSMYKYQGQGLAIAQISPKIVESIECVLENNMFDVEVLDTLYETIRKLFVMHIYFPPTNIPDRIRKLTKHVEVYSEVIGASSKSLKTADDLIGILYLTLDKASISEENNKYICQAIRAIVNTELLEELKLEKFDDKGNQLPLPKNPRTNKILKELDEKIEKYKYIETNTLNKTIS